MESSKIYCTVCGFDFKQEGQRKFADLLVVFEALPPDWRCPLCGVLKNLFKKTQEADAQLQGNSPRTFSE